MQTIHRFKVDKLVRDKLPEIMRESGVRFSENTMEDPEYIKRLQDKLREEVEEVLQANHPQEIQEELGDVLEVVRAIGKFYVLDFQDIVKTADKKN